MVEMQLQDDGNSAPAEAKDAVFVASDPVPEGISEVGGIDFNLHREQDISVADLVEGMSNMGFQASAVGDAVRIINGMVRGPRTSGCYLQTSLSDCPRRGRGRMIRLATRPPSFLATHLI